MSVNKQQFAKQLGMTIAKYRQERGLTQEQIAEKLGMGNEAISRIERGVAMPALVRLIEFAEIFECNISELLVESSTRRQDEAEYLQMLFTKVSDKDRAFIIKSVESLIEHLTHQDS